MSRSSPRASAALVLALALGGALGCVETALRESRVPYDYYLPPAVPDPPPSEGAIWPGETPSGSFLFFDRKARGIGDLVTVQVVESVLAEGSAETELESSSRWETDISSDAGFTELITQPLRRILRLIGIDGPGRTLASGAEVNILDAENDHEFEGEGSTKREGRFEAVVTCRIVNVLPGNVFHIRGRRSIVINHEMQYLTLEGLVRREDIGIDNSVPSTKLADAQLSFDGLGVIDDKQRPGVLSRVLSWLYPL